MAKLPGIYELMATTASPAINFGRGILGYQDPFMTKTMQDRMAELEAEKGPTGNVGYEDYGLPVTKPGGRFTGGIFDLALNNPVDFGLAGSVGRYSYSPEGRTGLKYDFTPDIDTGSTDNALLDFINEGGIKGKLSNIGKTISNALVSPLNAYEFNTADIQSRIDAARNREALNEQGLLSLDDAGLTTPAYEDFSQVARPGLNLGFAKQAGKGLLSLFTKNPVIKGIGGLLGLLGNKANLPGIVGGQDLRGDTGFDTFRRSTSLANFVQRRRDQKAREEAAARGLAKQRQAALQSMRGPIGGSGGGGVSAPGSGAHGMAGRAAGGYQDL
tara:strand:- start:9 stop:995 length:987 start_codon:yes stop_codon:yes gene_type:complete